jgi:hypothetical protein
VNVDDGSVWPQAFGSSAFISTARKAWDESGLAFGDMGDLTFGGSDMTFAEFTQRLRRTILGSAAGRFYRGIGNTDDGNAIAAFFETGISDLGTPTLFKTIQEIDHIFTRASAPQTVAVSLGVSNYGEARALSTQRTTDISGRGPFRTGHRVSARAVALRLDVSATQPVHWQGATAYTANRGLR